jgi:agmatinase
MENWKLNLPLTGIPTFCKAPLCEDWSKLKADVAVLGVPFDMSVGERPGARFGPKAIRDASCVYALAGSGYYDHELDEQCMGGVDIVDCGDVDMSHMDPQRCLQNTYEAALEIISKHKDVLLVSLGGDHAVPIPLLRAFRSKGPFHVVQFDSHLDYVDERYGVREAHNNTMRRISELDYVSGMTHIGIHGISSTGRKGFEEARSRGSTIIGPREFRRLGVENVLARIPEGVRFYVTIDVDALDITLAPGTGLPCPGGLNFYELTDTLRGIAARGKVVGFDFCEVAPMYDPAGITAQVAAAVIVDFLGAIFKERKKRA